ncbi:Glycoside hydrolase [Mycena venus]|uniref:glucan 1,3-beta-glucosidase n=1 Tax=Mycena venus TaxID=2733690 RepID=A0A8H6YJH9_9AGAR|nr:Glycoside hydrolase [Mycena venus]
MTHWQPEQGWQPSDEHWQPEPPPRRTNDFYSPFPRNESSLSLASSHNYASNDQASAYADSVYNLNPGGVGRGSYSHPSYHDEPALQPRRNDEKRATYLDQTSRRRRKTPILLSIAALVIILGAGGAAVYFFVFKKKDNAPKNASSPSDTTPANKIAVAVSGGDGSTVTAEDGSTFTYNNPFGGNWYWDVNDPFNNAARAQSWSPRLKRDLQFRVRSVNIGGWLVTEPFIVPGLYQTVQASAPPNITVIDEYTLPTGRWPDFMQIAAAGLNFVRIPLGYWAIEVLDGEGFLPRTSWTYFLKAIQWARKYGLRINLDLHALPGSQNGWNHSGRLGTYNVLFGPMGIANAQRSLDYVRILAEFISQPEYKDVIPMFGITNEPQGGSITKDILSRYYLQAYNNVRLASGIGQGSGPFASFPTPIAPRSICTLTFASKGNPRTPSPRVRTNPCDQWGALFNNTMRDFGFIVAGEFSNAVVDCGLYVNGVNLGTRYEGTYTLDGQHPNLGNCTTDWLDYENWDDTTKAAYKTLAKSSMDALQNWFFWTWKIGNSTAGKIEAPHWSYQLGLQEGWMPTDPREAVGQCKNTSPFNGPLSAWQTGGVGAGAIPTDVVNALAWPPPSIMFPNSVTSPGNLLPTYAPAGTPITMPGPTVTPASGAPSATHSVNVGNGWANANDQAGMMQPIEGCFYFDPWVGSSQAPPSPLCTNAAAVRALAAPEPAITTPPSRR